MARPENRTYREIAEQDYGLLMCSSAVGCKKKLSVSAHVRGRLDRANVIHLARADGKPTRAGMRTFLVLVARALHDRDWRDKPIWERLYLENTWATRQAKMRHRTRIRVAESIDDRLRAHRAAQRAGVSLRTSNFILYQWVRFGLLYTKTNTAQH